MTPANQQHVANAPIEPTPRSKRGAKLHGLKLDYYADTAQGDIVMLSWPGCSTNVAFGSEEEILAVMKGILKRLSAVAHERAALADRETDQMR